MAQPDRFLSVPEGSAPSSVAVLELDLEKITCTTPLEIARFLNRHKQGPISDYLNSVISSFNALIGTNITLNDVLAVYSGARVEELEHFPTLMRFIEKTVKFQYFVRSDVVRGVDSDASSNQVLVFPRVFEGAVRDLLSEVSMRVLDLLKTSNDTSLPQATRFSQSINLRWEPLLEVDEIVDTCRARPGYTDSVVRSLKKLDLPQRERLLHKIFLTFFPDESDISPAHLAQILSLGSTAFSSYFQKPTLTREDAEDLSGLITWLHNRSRLEDSGLQVAPLTSLMSFFRTLVEPETCDENQISLVRNCPAWQKGLILRTAAYLMSEKRNRIAFAELIRLTKIPKEDLDRLLWGDTTVFIHNEAIVRVLHFFRAHSIDEIETALSQAEAIQEEVGTWMDPTALNTVASVHDLNRALQAAPDYTSALDIRHGADFAHLPPDKTTYHLLLRLASAQAPDKTTSLQDIEADVMEYMELMKSMDFSWFDLVEALEQLPQINTDFARFVYDYFLEGGQTVEALPQNVARRMKARGQIS